MTGTKLRHPLPARHRRAACPDANARADKTFPAPAPPPPALHYGCRVSILDEPIARLDGTAGTLRDLTGGHPALLVNVASRCGLTPQYTALEQLHEKYAAPRLHRRRAAVQPVRRPGAGQSEEIAEFCSATYGVTFPMSEKVDVNGEHRHPVYPGLVQTPDESGKAGDVTWNFEKFLLAADGTVVARFGPQDVPGRPTGDRRDRARRCLSGHGRWASPPTWRCSASRARRSRSATTTSWCARPPTRRTTGATAWSWTGSPGRARSPGGSTTFDRAHPHAGHVAIGIDDPGTSRRPCGGGRGPSSRSSGTSSSPRPAWSSPPPRSTDVECRAVDVADDAAWADLVTWRSGRTTAARPRGSRTLPTRRTPSTRRARRRPATARWFAAYLPDGRPVASLGVFAVGAGLARYQDVMTDADHRRRGIAGRAAPVRRSLGPGPATTCGHWSSSRTPTDRPSACTARAGFDDHARAVGAVPRSRKSIRQA